MKAVTIVASALLLLLADSTYIGPHAVVPWVQRLSIPENATKCTTNKDCTSLLVSCHSYADLRRRH